MITFRPLREAGETGHRSGRGSESPGRALEESGGREAGSGGAARPGRTKAGGDRPRPAPGPRRAPRLMPRPPVDAPTKAGSGGCGGRAPG